MTSSTLSATSGDSTFSDYYDRCQVEDYLHSHSQRAEREESQRFQRLALNAESERRALARLPIAEAFRASCTVAELLRDEQTRRHLAAAVAAGKQYVQSDTATQATVTEAMSLLRARGDRRSCRGVARAALAGEPGRVLRLAAERRAQRAAAAAARRLERIKKALAAGRLGRQALDRLLPSLYGRVCAQADQAVVCVVGQVGTIGQQCRSDLDRLETETDGSIGRRHGLERETTLARVEHLADWSAALVTLRTHSHYYSHAGIGGGDRRHVGGDQYACYLVVRDSTTGEAHILRVAPKFGNDGTRFFRSFVSPAARIRAAVAASFGLRAAAYRPDVEA